MNHRQKTRATAIVLDDVEHAVIAAVSTQAPNCSASSPEALVAIGGA